MKHVLIYASGSEKNAPEGFTSWRDELKTFLAWHNDKITFLDPMVHFNYTDKPSKTTRQCSNYFMWMIDRCDVLLVNLDHSDVSVGTGCEVQHGFDNRKPIIGFGVKPETWYEWTADKCDIVFDTQEEAIEYIVEHYCEL